MNILRKISEFFGREKKQSPNVQLANSDRASYERIRREVELDKSLQVELAEYKRKAEAEEAAGNLEEAADIYYNATEYAVISGVGVQHVSNFYERMADIYRRLGNYTLERFTIENYIRNCESEGAHCAKRFYDRLKAIQTENDNWAKLHQELHAIGAEGRGLEKTDPEAAIARYLDAVQFAKDHPKIDLANVYSTYLDRLAILYRKLKLYQKEVEILEYHVSICDRDNSYWKARVVERLEKAIALRDKHENK